MARLDPHPPAFERQPLSQAELDRAVRAADPTALLVPARIVRRVIRTAVLAGGIGLRVPHRKLFVIGRSELLSTVDLAELDLRERVELPESVILIARPSAESLESMTGEQVLTKYWRLLFHARVHLALDTAAAEGRMSDDDVRDRIRQIGESEFEEIRLVLRGEDLLLPPKTDLVVYTEFAAVYLELRTFAPSLVGSYFPSLGDLLYIDELLRRDVDVEGLLATTRLSGAAAPGGEGAEMDRHRFLGPRHDAPVGPRRLPARKRSDRQAAMLVARADRMRRLGNVVRSAILRTRAARYATAENARAARDEARRDLSRLARRLQAPLNFSAAEADEWSKSLASLLEQSALGIWTAEARMLYDLQKVCIDHERGIYTLDVVGWITSLGRKSLRRFLPGQRDVLISKHLRIAARRLSAARLTQRSRSRLAGLLQSAVHRAEATLRARFKPAIERALDKVKLLPQNPPERVARKKLVDEILDRIVDRGFLTMGDLRDALSRNNLKLPDLTSAQEFFLGDQLLKADRQLAAGLDGVYHGGEIYLRWPQRFSSLAFGTPAGRLLTRYAAIPFGGAFLILEGLQHVVSPVARAVSDGNHPVHLMSLPTVIGLGLLLLGLLYNARFRALSLDATVRIGRACRFVLIDLPAMALRWSWLQGLVRSWPYRLARRFVFRPLAVTALVVLGITLLVGSLPTWTMLLGLFAGACLALNSPVGRNVDEMVTDWLVQTWHRVRIHLFAAMFRFVMDVFNRILETIERLLYTVDEWLRFRAGERRSATVAKAVLGFVWFFVNYVIRFCVNLLVEPQVNPIKHFPVVTVSHKILLPLTPLLQSALAAPLGSVWATAIAPTVILLMPGVFGFLVWELKENWRLYAANRPRQLQPVPIGHHGETLIQFLRPGFRSGTVPKLYAKLRRAERKALYTENWKAVGKQLEGLHHASESVRRFVDRELLAILHESRSWADRTITVGEIRLGCNRILVELYCQELAEDSMWLSFDEQAGWLAAGTYHRGWADGLAYARRHALASALAGFYKMAGVDVVREQVESRLEPGSRGYEITSDALVVWTAAGAQREFPLRDWPALSQPAVDNDERRRWVFAVTPISWRRWVVTWELDQLEGSSRHHVLENMHLLPG
jgi:hypothetical protein